MLIKLVLGLLASCKIWDVYTDECDRALCGVESEGQEWL